MSPPPGSESSLEPKGLVAGLRAGFDRLRRRIERLITPAARGVPLLPGPGGRIERRRHVGQAGRRDYLLHIPSGGAPTGLVVMLHGCKQTPEDFALGTGMNRAAAAHGLLVAWPRQMRSANPMRCWNWFRLANQLRRGGEAGILAGIADEVIGEFGLTSRRVFVAGLSAGGAMASILAHTHPDLFAAAGIHSGVAWGSAHDARSGLAAMKGRFDGPAEPLAEGAPMVPTILFQGLADAAVAPINAERILTGLTPGESARTIEERREIGGKACRITTGVDAAGRRFFEAWLVEEAGHAWFGGDPQGSWTDASGPDATAEMLRFFLETAERSGEPGRR